MRESLDSRVKTIPSNYNYVPEDQSVPGAEVPGYSITPEALAKAERMESEYYDWSGYEACIAPKVEHPEYIQRSKMEACFRAWNELLNKLEPLPRGP